jgi:3-hydroxybutyryl-CoA dehydrogenase
MPGVIGVVGAGTMGAGIAQLAVEAGHCVRLHDVDTAAIALGRSRVKAGLERRAGRLDLDPDSADEWVAGRLALLEDAPSIGDAAADAELVIEAALEDLAAKRSIFAALDAAAPETTILATNTSALSVADIAAASRRPAFVLGLHFFNPAPVMPLVEVVGAPATIPAAIERAIALVTSWGKVAVRCADTPGFIVNRVNRPFTLEALAMLEDGRGSVTGIDAAVRAEGYPMGPFELMDLIGLDVNLAATFGVFEGTRARRDPLAERFRPSRIQERLVAAGRLGRKTGGGYYAYDAAGAATGEALDLGVPDLAADALAPEEIARRITFAIVNEAYRALGDGVATSADIDLAMRLGAGHPLGPFERAAAMGGPAGVRARLAGLAGEGPRFDPAPGLVAGGD